MTSNIIEKATHWTESEPVRLAAHRAGRVYLAGPMTGLPDLNFPAFNAEAANLRAQGLTVINPAEHGIVEGAEWADYLRHDLAGLMSCERIHLLQGWQDSKGARLEVHAAKALGMQITYQDGATLAKCDGNHGDPRCADPECWNDSPAQPAAGVSDESVWQLWLRVCAESENLSTRVMIAKFARAILALLPQAESKWEGAEEWMPLAWALCADECGEDACTELVWEGGPIPEPWGDRWLKYEDEAKRLIKLVRKHVPALRPPQAESEARRAAQEQLYTERERHTVEVKRLQAEIGRLQALRPQAVPMTPKVAASYACVKLLNDPCMYRDRIGPFVEWFEAHHGITAKARFPAVHCSQCGGTFGPGNAGFSHCSDHDGITAQGAQDGEGE